MFDIPGIKRNQLDYVYLDALAVPFLIYLFTVYLVFPLPKKKDHYNIKLQGMASIFPFTIYI